MAAATATATTAASATGDALAAASSTGDVSMTSDDSSASAPASPSKSGSVSILLCCSSRVLEQSNEKIGLDSDAGDGQRRDAESDAGGVDGAGGGDDDDTGGGSGGGGQGGRRLRRRRLGGRRRRRGVGRVQRQRVRGHAPSKRPASMKQRRTATPPVRHVRVSPLTRSLSFTLENHPWESPSEFPSTSDPVSRPFRALFSSRPWRTLGIPFEFPL